MKYSFFFIVVFFISSNCIAQESFNMNLLGHWDNDILPLSVNGKTFNDCWGYAADDREYAILGGAGAIHFFDITEPENLEPLASFECGVVTNWRDMKTFGDRAYAVADASTDGLLIFDLSNLPNEVTKTNQLNDVFEDAHNIFIDEFGKAYIVGASGPYDLIIYDVAANPDAPEVVGAVTLEGTYVHDIYVRNNIAYCSHGYSGLFVYNVEDPANPILLANVDTPGYNHSSWLLDNETQLIFAEELPKGQPLGFINLENIALGDIELESSFKFPLLAPTYEDNTPHNPFVVGNLVFVSYYEDGLQVFDISDTENPTVTAWYDTYENTTYTGTKGNWGVYPFLPSGKIIVSDSHNGLFILELDETSSNEEVMQTETLVHPNPILDQMSIEMENPGVYQLTNIEGKVMMTGALPKGISSINTTALFPGVYFLTVRSETGNFVQKIIKQ